LVSRRRPAIQVAFNRRFLIAKGIDDKGSAELGLSDRVRSVDVNVAMEMVCRLEDTQ
jgi:hypothetical protein